MLKWIARAAGALALVFIAATGPAAQGEAAAPPPPAAAPSPAPAQEVLARYVGRYSLSPDVEVTITLEDGRLYGALTGRPKHELLAKSPTDFYARDVDAQASFELGPDGHPVGVHLTINGQVAYAPRIAEEPAPAS